MIPQGNHPDDLQKAERMAYLIAGHLRGTLTEDEAAELDEWITESDENLALFEKLTDEENIEAAMARYRVVEEGKAKALKGLKKKLRTPRRSFGLLSWLVAASVLVIVALSWLLLSKTKTTIEKPSHVHVQHELPAASSEAVLTLSDGRTLILDSTAKGVLASDGTVSINQNTGGLLQYTGTETAMRYNTVSTPRGGQYKLVLGDGTKVWLNADSYLKFPAGFTGAQRNVQLKGEAYFEVAKDADHPFIVTVTGTNGTEQTLEVFGTHFNINAYGDENGIIKTTLMEGLVQVTAGAETKRLYPGEESVVGPNASLTTHRSPDLSEALAWKNGKFIFNNATIQSIGNQLSRWYDVDVEYAGKITQHFNTEADRSLPLQELIKGLEGTNEAQFILQGRKLIIRPARVLQ
jgi:transmembrane sensor